MRRLLALIAGLLMPWAAWSQSCPYWQVLTFGDGQKACLTDYHFSQENPVGFTGRVRDLIAAPGLAAVVRTRPGPQCPAVTGFAVGGIAHSFTPGQMRAERALRSCEAALSREKSSADCRCEVLLTDGRSTLPKAEFEKVVGHQSAANVAAAPAVTSPAPKEPPREPPKPPPAPVAVAPQPPAAAPAVAPAFTEAARTVPRQSARALVIGNGQYTSFAVLPNPARDARAIARKLQSFGIEVDLVLDADRDQLIHALNDHSRKAAGKDVSLFFYAGHGVQVEGINYLIPVNMRADGVSAGYVKLAGIALNAVMDYLPAKTRIIFLDACRDNPVSRSLIGGRGGSGAGLAPVNVAGGTMIAYATRDGATAEDGAGQNSPYTTALLQHLDSPIDISLTLRQVRQTVLRLTSGRQEPWEYGSLTGEQIVLPLMAKQ